MGIAPPALGKVPMIAMGYDLDPAEAIWAWLISYQPTIVRYLASTVNYEASRVLRDSAERRYADQVAQGAAQKVRTQGFINKLMPTIETLDERPDYVQVGDQGDQRDAQQGNLARGTFQHDALVEGFKEEGRVAGNWRRRNGGISSNTSITYPDEHRSDRRVWNTGMLAMGPTKLTKLT
jgi:hypothetical protein